MSLNSSLKLKSEIFKKSLNKIWLLELFLNFLCLKTSEISESVNRGENSKSELYIKIHLLQL